VSLRWYVCGGRGLCVSGFRGLFFCKMDVITKFAVSANDCGEIFFPGS